jgi:hypothetical protein
MTTIYDVGNPCYDLGQAQQCDGIELVTGIPTQCCHYRNKTFTTIVVYNRQIVLMLVDELWC